MVQLKEKTLKRLRDKLQEKGQRPSLPNIDLNLPDKARQTLLMTIRYGPLCEAMYLMMSADDRVLNIERDVLKGAMRSLVDDSISSVHIEAMLDTAAKKLASQGRQKRLDSVIESLKSDATQSEVAFVLAAAVALADGELESREEEMLEQLSKGLNINEEKVQEIMNELEHELARRTTPAGE